MLAEALSRAERRAWLKPTHEGVLLVLLAIEIAVFGATGRNFLSGENAFETVRLSVEIGLLALAMTPVIVTGGIDLSVGSLMGLSAVLLGKMWRDGGIPIGLAAIFTLGIGAAGGLLNALLITRLRIPPLIVTLGSYSLFRGLAEGLTGGSDSFHGFPDLFLALGRGWQIPLFAAGLVAFYLLLHRTAIGRALYAIGFSPEGARHAGIPVERRLTFIYVLSGLVAGLAAVIYVAHLAQAKADAGSGYELMAITAVVLGGTSIFGGRGNIHGTLIGLFAIAVLDRGLRLSDLPAELAKILVGILLVVSIGANQLLSRMASRKKIERDAA